VLLLAFLFIGLDLASDWEVVPSPEGLTRLDTSKLLWKMPENSPSLRILELWDLEFI
jgi:hypothetical protein